MCEENTPGRITSQKSVPGSNSCLTAYIVSDAVERLGKNLSGQDNFSPSRSDKLGCLIRFFVPEIFDIDLGDQCARIKDNNSLTHGC